MVKRVVGRPGGTNRSRMGPVRMKAYASFAEWRKDQTPAQRKVIDALAQVIDDAVPGLEQSVKWGQGSWGQGKHARVYVHVEPDHVQLGFYAGATLKDPDGVLEGKGKFVRFVRVRRVGDVDPVQLRPLIRQAAE